METFSTSRRSGRRRSGSTSCACVRRETRLRERTRANSPYTDCEDEREHADGDVEHEPDEPREHEQQEHEPEDDDRAPQPVRADLLLERHAAGAGPGNDTSGPTVSPWAEKNSRSRKPSGFARSSHGKLCTAVLKCITVAL